MIKAHISVSQWTTFPSAHAAAAGLPIVSFRFLSQESLTSALCLLTVGTCERRRGSHLCEGRWRQPPPLLLWWSDLRQFALRKSPEKPSAISILLTLLYLHCERGLKKSFNLCLRPLLRQFLQEELLWNVASICLLVSGGLCDINLPRAVQLLGWGPRTAIIWPRSQDSTSVVCSQFPDVSHLKVYPNFYHCKQCYDVHLYYFWAYLWFPFNKVLK